MANDHYISRFLTKPWEVGQRQLWFYDFKADRLEALKGDLAGYHSIRINDQWRIVFKWKDGAAHDVRIVDYH